MAYNQEDVSQFNSMMYPPQNQNQMMSSATYSNYNLPMREVYEATKIKNTNEYQTFINFLKYKEALDLTELMEKQGIITINRPELVEEEKTQVSAKDVLIATGVIFLIIKIGIAIAL